MLLLLFSVCIMVKRDEHVVTAGQFRSDNHTGWLPDAVFGGGGVRGGRRRAEFLLLALERRRFPDDDHDSRRHSVPSQQTLRHRDAVYVQLAVLY